MSAACRSAFAIRSRLRTPKLRVSRPHGCAALLSGGGPSGRCRAILQLSHGGPDTSANILPQRMWFFQLASLVVSVRSQDGSITTSTEMTRKTNGSGGAIFSKQY